MMGLEVNDISVTYRNGHTALFNASFTLPQGSITALVGINGYSHHFGVSCSR